MGFLSLLGGLRAIKINWKIVAILGVLALVIYGVYTWKNDIKKAAYDSLFSDLREQELLVLTNELEKMRDINEVKEAKTRQLQNELDKVRKEVEVIKQQLTDLEDGEVAPVLRRAIELIP